MKSQTERHASVELAISQVLAAERDVLAEIKACEERADGILRAARKSVRGLVRHANDRISRLHAGSAAKTRELVTALDNDASGNALTGESDESRRQHLTNAVRDVARELTVLDEGDES